MTREIKFRAWVKDHWIGKTSGPMIYDWQDTIYVESCTFQPDGVPIMQYTGLKDKNGKEIYEGDILRGMWGKQEYIEKQEIAGPVVFSDGCFEWETWLKKFRGFDGRFKIRWKEYFPTCLEYREIDAIEVIGNIYETPEKK